MKPTQNPLQLIPVKRAKQSEKGKEKEQDVGKRKKEKEKLTQSQIRHIQLPQLQLLRTRHRRPGQIVGDTSQRRHGRLRGVDEEMNRDLDIVSHQRSDGPRAQWDVVEEFHVCVDVEPCSAQNIK